MADKYKKNKGNKYVHNQEFAEEVIAKNRVHHNEDKINWRRGNL
ncbi:hypothetical protein [Paenibacillus crassostreae]|nr:hypothetical protein [Paenibacillus crassostreae]